MACERVVRPVMTCERVVRPVMTCAIGGTLQWKNQLTHPSSYRLVSRRLRHERDVHFYLTPLHFVVYVFHCPYLTPLHFVVYVFRCPYLIPLHMYIVSVY